MKDPWPSGFTYAPCADCPGEVIVGQFDTITVVLKDDDGFPIFETDGTLMYVKLKLPQHRANTGLARSPFDPTGLAPAPCKHGLPEHPNGGKSAFAVSWIRAKYLVVGKDGVKCPVCRGEPAPDDMLTPRVAA